MKAELKPEILFYLKIHKYFAKQESTNSNGLEDNVYKNILKHVVYKRDTKLEDYSSKTQALKEKYTLYFEEEKNFLFGSNTPLFIARTNSTRENDDKASVVYEKRSWPITGLKINSHEDGSKKSAVSAVTELNGTTHIGEEIEDCLYIRSLPESMVKKFQNDPSGVEDHQSVFRENRDFHLSCNLTEQEYENFIESDRVFDPQEIYNYIIEEYTVYPEILVVVDYETYLAHDKDLTSLASYMSAFWNGVDLRFRELHEPKVRLNIAGLVVTTDPKAEPYLKSNLANKTNEIKFTLYDIGKHFSKKLDHKHDIVAYISHRTLGKKQNEDRTGLAFVGTGCKNAFSSVFITDRGGFEGVIHAAHELGHLFGSVHDGEKSVRVPGGLCSWNDSFIMGRSKGTKNRWHWSDCSLTAMRDYLRSSNATCFRNKPEVGVPYEKKLPGKLLSRHEQCGRMFPGYISFDETNCNKLSCRKCLFYNFFCYDGLSYGVAPAEGTPCGEKHLCIDGECVVDPETSD